MFRLSMEGKKAGSYGCERHRAMDCEINSRIKHTQPFQRLAIYWRGSYVTLRAFIDIRRDRKSRDL